MTYEHPLTYLEVMQSIDATKQLIEQYEHQAQINRLMLKAFEEELKNHNPPEGYNDKTDTKPQEKDRY
jgi:hypothetical protein